jgi:hypothetical protein
VEQVLGAIGLEWDALFPDKPIEHGKRQRRPFLPDQVFEIARHEIAVAAICAGDMHANRSISDADYERMFLVVQRLNDIARSAYGR